MIQLDNPENSSSVMESSETKDLSPISNEPLTCHCPSSPVSPGHQRSPDPTPVISSEGVSYLSPKHPNITSRKRDSLIKSKRNTGSKGDCAIICCPSDMLMNQELLIDEQDLTANRDICYQSMSQEQVNSLLIPECKQCLVDHSETSKTGSNEIINNNNIDVEKIGDSKTHDLRLISANITHIPHQNVVTTHDATDFAEESVVGMEDLCICFAVESVAALIPLDFAAKEKLEMRNDVIIGFCHEKDTRTHGKGSSYKAEQIFSPAAQAVCSHEDLGPLIDNSTTKNTPESGLGVDQRSLDIEADMLTISLYSNNGVGQNYPTTNSFSCITELTNLECGSVASTTTVDEDDMMVVDNSPKVSPEEESCLTNTRICPSHTQVDADKTEPVKESSSLDIEDMFSKMSLSENCPDNHSRLTHMHEPDPQSYQDVTRLTRSATRHLREGDDVKVVYVHPDVTKRQSTADLEDIDNEPDNSHDEISWQRCYMRPRRIRSPTRPQIADIGATDRIADDVVVTRGEASRTSARRRQTHELLAEAELAVNQGVPPPSPRTAYRQIVAQTSSSLQRTLHLRRTSLAHQRPDVDQVIDSQHRLLEAVLDGRPAAFESGTVSHTPFVEGYGDQVPYWVFVVTLLVTFPALLYWIIYL